VRRLAVLAAALALTGCDSSGLTSAQRDAVADIAADTADAAVNESSKVADLETRVAELESQVEDLTAKVDDLED